MHGHYILLQIFVTKSYCTYFNDLQQVVCWLNLNNIYYNSCQIRINSPSNKPDKYWLFQMFLSNCHAGAGADKISLMLQLNCLYYFFIPGQQQNMTALILFNTQHFNLKYELFIINYFYSVLEDLDNEENSACLQIMNIAKQ